MEDPRIEVCSERLLVFRCPQVLSVGTSLKQRDSVIDQLSVQPGKKVHKVVLVLSINYITLHLDEKKCFGSG